MGVLKTVTDLVGVVSLSALIRATCIHVGLLLIGLVNGGNMWLALQVKPECRALHAGGLVVAHLAFD